MGLHARVELRYEDLNSRFNEKDYAKASKEVESIENLQLSETRAYEIDLQRKTVLCSIPALDTWEI